MKGVLRLVLILSLVLGAATTAFAANGDTLNIGGQVPLTLTLTVAADAAADNLDLDSTDTATTATIAAITIATNNTAGWELWVFSENSDVTDTGMINADGDEFVYTIGYTGTGGVATTDITSTGLLVGEGGIGSTSDTGDLEVTYTRSTTAAAGYYSDQLAVVLRAK